MTKLSDHDWELLNAWADGELDKDAAAKVERLVASDAEWAAAAQEVRHVSTALAAMRPAGSGVPAVAHTNRQPWRWLAGLAVAAGVFAVAMTGAFSTTKSPMDIHQAFLAQDFVYGGNAQPQPVTGQNIKGFPTLVEANLSLVLTALDGPLESAHYVGQNACRLTVIRASSLAPPEGGDGQFADWIAGEMRYRAIATGMDPSKFDAVTTYLEQATQKMIKPQTILALESVMHTAAACV